MKKAIITSAIMAGLLSTSLYAYGKTGCNMQQQHHGKQMGQYHGKKMHKMHGQKKGMHAVSKKFMRLLHQLNLNQEQYAQIKMIMHTPKPKNSSPFAAFGKDSFDKEKFIAQMSQQRENMLKFKAEKIEKVYNVLTATQKSQLRVLMDLQEGKGN